MIAENKVHRLPDYYEKSYGSNNWKILELQHQGARLLSAEVELVRIASDITKATGYALDVWGEIEGLQRNGLDDEAYRGQLLVQIARDMISVDYTQWYQTVLQTFGRSADEIVMRETENPFEYEFTKFPLSAVTDIGLDINTATSLIEAILPITGELLEILYDAGVPKGLTANVGTIAGVAASQPLGNDIDESREFYLTARALVAADAELLVAVQGNTGRAEQVRLGGLLISAGTTAASAAVVTLRMEV